MDTDQRAVILPVRIEIRNILRRTDPEENFAEHLETIVVSEESRVELCCLEKYEFLTQEVIPRIALKDKYW